MLVNVESRKSRVGGKGCRTEGWNVKGVSYNVDERSRDTRQQRDGSFGDDVSLTVSLAVSLTVSLTVNLAVSLTVSLTVNLAVRRGVNVVVKVDVKVDVNLASRRDRRRRQGSSTDPPQSFNDVNSLLLSTSGSHTLTPERLVVRAA